MRPVRNMRRVLEPLPYAQLKSNAASPAAFLVGLIIRYVGEREKRCRRVIGSRGAPQARYVLLGLFPLPAACSGRAGMVLILTRGSICYKELRYIDVRRR